MKRKIKLCAAVSLLVQSCTMVIMFFILWAKKKSIAEAVFALAAIEGAAGAYLLHQMKDEEEFDPEDYLDYDEYDDLDFDEADINELAEDGEEEKAKFVEIPREDVVSDAEFEH